MQRTDELTPFFEKYTFFRTYWDRTLDNKLRKYVYQPLLNKNINQLWTNNNSESMNNRLKRAADWKQHKLPDLIEKLTKVVSIQHLDIRRAIHGSGNFKLAKHMQHHYIDQDTWHNTQNTIKNTKFQNFLIEKKAVENTNNYITSSKLKTFVCLKPNSNSGRKPGQRRRARAERAVRKPKSF